MIRALHTAATGMMAQQMSMDTIANNLSNSNTVGFKKTRVDFEDLLYQTTRVAGAPIGAGGEIIPTGLDVGLGVRPSATEKIFTQGVFQETDNQLDLAIEGDGFFQIRLPDGTITYTRNGAFSKDANGTIVNTDGFQIEPSIVIPTDAIDISVGPDGTVSVTTQGSTSPTSVGQITTARFVNPQGLKALGKNLYIETAASGTPTTGAPGSSGLGTIAQGVLENSNVQVVEEMVNMIIAQRAYDIISKSIQGSDEMLKTTASLPT